MPQPAPRDRRRTPLNGDASSRSIGAPTDVSAVAAVLSRIPAQDHLVTASCDGRRSGALVRWVQRCGLEPPMVCVAMRKGHPIEPLIRDSRNFALVQVAPDDSLLRRLFATEHACDDDPFLSLPVMSTPCGSPVPLRASAYLDCEMLRHLDIECDHEIYVGVIRHAAILAAAREGDPPSGRASRTA